MSFLTWLTIYVIGFLVFLGLAYLFKKELDIKKEFGSAVWLAAIWPVTLCMGLIFWLARHRG